MKAFKKITAFAVAMTMGCSVFAFTACTPNDDDGGDNNVTSNLPAGKPAQAIDATFASALKEEKDYLTLNYTNKTNGTDTHHTKTNGVETATDTTTYEINLTASGKVDLKGGNADLVAKSVATFENDKGKDVSYSIKNNNYVEYDFLRSWNMFSYKAEKEVTDFTDVELSHDGSANINWEEILGQIGSIGGGSGAATYAEAPDLSALPTTGDLAKLSLANENTVLVKLAAAANTLKYENGVYSIDLIETVDTVIKEVGTVVAALEGDNTVGDILNNAIVKKYFSVITELVPVETVKATVSMAIDALSTIENVKPLLLYIQQDLDALKTVSASTTYDYIVSLISSQNLVNIANTVITIMQSQGTAPTADVSVGEVASPAFFTKTLDKYSVNEILTIVNSMVQPTLPITLEVVQNAYKSYVEAVCNGGKLIIDKNSAITELSVEYKVESGKLSSQKVSYAFENKHTYEMGSSTSDGVTTAYSTDSAEKQEGVIEIAYDTSAPALKDISANTVSHYEYEWDEEDLYLFTAQDLDGEDWTVYDFYVGAYTQNGEYAGLKLYNASKEEIGQGTDYVDFQVGETSYRIYEQNRSNGEQKSIYYNVDRVNAGTVNYASLTQTKVKYTATVAEIIAAK